jgi:hypothetical protein
MAFVPRTKRGREGGIWKGEAERGREGKRKGVDGRVRYGKGGREDVGMDEDEDEDEWKVAFVDAEAGVMWDVGCGMWDVGLGMGNGNGEWGVVLSLAWGHGTPVPKE